MKSRLQYDYAFALAQEAILNLTPACIKIEIAGSLRRRRPTVGDIEIVCILKHDLDLFGEILTYDQKMNLTISIQGIVDDILDTDKVKFYFERMRDGEEDLD